MSIVLIIIVVTVSVMIHTIQHLINYSVENKESFSFSVTAIMVYLEQLSEDLESLTSFADTWKGRKMPGEK